MINQLKTIVDRLKPFHDVEVKGDISLSQIKLLTAAVGGTDSQLLVSLVETINKVAGVVRTTEKVTVGKIIGHPELVKFIEGLPKGPDYKVLRCPRCGKLAERDVRAPAPCPCGFTWQVES